MAREVDVEVSHEVATVAGVAAACDSPAIQIILATKTVANTGHSTQQSHPSIPLVEQKSPVPIYIFYYPHFEKWNPGLFRISYDVSGATLIRLNVACNVRQVTTTTIAAVTATADTRWRSSKRTRTKYELEHSTTTLWCAWRAASLKFRFELPASSRCRAQ